MSRLISLFIAVCLVSCSARAQKEIIVFEHIGWSHSGIYSSMSFRGTLKPIWYHSDQVWSVDSLSPLVFDKLDSLLQTYSPELSNGKDTTKFGTYKISSFSNNGTIKYIFYVYGLNSAIDFFKWLSDSTYRFPDSDLLYEKFQNLKYILETKRE